jgi:hypothetical protein
MKFQHEWPMFNGVDGMNEWMNEWMYEKRMKSNHNLKDI